MPKIDVQHIFAVRDDKWTGDTLLKLNANGKVFAHEIQYDDAPLSAEAERAARTESLKHLDIFWTAIRDSPLYGKASANYVKPLFDEARNNGEIPLSVRFVRSVLYRLEEQIHLSIRDEVEAKGLIPPTLMQPFMYALIKDKLDWGQNRADITRQAVASFMRSTCLAPQELMLRYQPDSLDERKAAIKLNLYDLQKNPTLKHTLERCMEQGQGYNQTITAVVPKLINQMHLLESLEPQTLRAMMASDKADKLFFFLEKLMASQNMPGLTADVLMAACLRCSAEGNALRTKGDINQVRDTAQSIVKERAANLKTDAELREHALASSPQVRRATRQYLEKTYGQQANYTQAQSSEALRVTSGIFSLANMEALNAAKRNGLLDTGSPDMVRRMTQAVASMNEVVNTILDKHSQIDEALLNKMSDLAKALHDAHMDAESSDLDASPQDFRRVLVKVCLEGKDIPEAELSPLLKNAQNTLSALTTNLDTIAASLESGKLVSADLQNQGIFSVASRMMDSLRTDFKALDDQLAPAQNAEPAPHAAPLASEAPAAPAPAPAPNLSALHLASTTESMENTVDSLPEAVRQALNALAPAVTTAYALPNAALKAMLADVQANLPAHGQVPLGNLSTVRLREALVRHLANVQADVVRNGNAQPLTEADWQTHIRLGVEKYVQGLADVIRKVDEALEVDPRIELMAEFNAQNPQANAEARRNYRDSLPRAQYIFTAAQKDSIKQALPLYGLRDVDTILGLASAACSNEDCADLVLQLPTLSNMAHALTQGAMKKVDSVFRAVTCPPQDMRDALDFLLDVSLRLHTNAATDMLELQRRMDSQEVHSIGEQLTFLRNARSAQDSTHPLLQAQSMSTALTATRVLESLHRISHHYRGDEVPNEPGLFLRNDSIHHVSQVDPRVYELVNAPDNEVHTALYSARPPLNDVQYMQLAQLLARLAPNKSNLLVMSRILANCASRLTAALAQSKTSPDKIDLPLVWETICGFPPVPDLTEQNFAARMIDLLNSKATLLSTNKNIAQLYPRGEEWVSYGFDPRALMRKSDFFFTLEDCHSAVALESRTITSPNSSTYQLATDLSRTVDGSVYAIKGETGNTYMVRKGGRPYTPEENHAQLQKVVAMANQVCSNNPLQSRMLQHLQTQAGEAAIDYLATFLSASGEGDKHGVTHYEAEKSKDEHVLLRIFNGPDSPINYTKNWDISPDGTARLVQMDIARNPLYGTPLEKLPAVQMHVDPIAESESHGPLYTLASVEDVDKVPLVKQGQNACFLTCIINGMLRTQEGRNALKARFQGRNFMVDNPDTHYDSQVGYSLDAQDEEVNESRRLLAILAAENGQSVPEDQVNDGYSAIELGLLAEYAKVDSQWQKGRMGVAIDAAPLLGFELEPDTSNGKLASFTRESPAPGSPTEKVEEVRKDNWEMHELAAKSLQLKGRIPILYKGTTINETMTGHYMAVVGVYGQGQDDPDGFGLIVHDSLTKKLESFPLDNLTMHTQFYDNDRQLVTSRVMLNTLMPRKKDVDAVM